MYSAVPVLPSMSGMSCSWVAVPLVIVLAHHRFHLIVDACRQRIRRIGRARRIGRRRSWATAPNRAPARRQRSAMPNGDAVTCALADALLTRSADGVGDGHLAGDGGHAGRGVSRCRARAGAAALVRPSGGRFTASLPIVVLHDRANAVCSGTWPRSKLSSLGIWRPPMFSAARAGDDAVQVSPGWPAERPRQCTVLKVEPGGYRPVSAIGPCASAAGFWPTASTSPVEGWMTDHRGAAGQQRR